MTELDLKARIEELERKVLDLSRINDALTEAYKTKSEFLVNLSHELRNPLTSIIGFSEILRDELFGPLNTRQKEHVVHIWESGHRLLTLIDDILDLSRIEVGKATLEYTDAFPRQIVEAALLMVNQIAYTEGVIVTSFIAPEAEQTCTMDARKVKQMLFHLLIASIKMCERGGTVSLNTSIQGPDLFFVIRDSGPGLMGHEVERAFTEFAKLELKDNSIRKLGVSLALARSLARMHGGDIVLCVEGGNVFNVKLPGCVKVAHRD